MKQRGVGAQRGVMRQPPLWRAGMADVLTTVLAAVRLRGRVLCRSELAAPWGMSIEPRPLAYFHVIERGGAWLRMESHRPVALAAGDLVVLPHGHGHILSDAPESRAVPLLRLLRAREEGPGHSLLRSGGRGAVTQFVCGAFSFEWPETHPLLPLLPDVLHVRAAADESRWIEPTLRLLTEETRTPGPGTETIVSRVVDILFVQALRAWMRTLPDGAGGWLGALRDRHVGAALGLIHRHPERSWTIERLAREVGLSRSPFAARFTALVGQPPLAYLTGWRMVRAASWLADGTVALSEISERVGYGSEAAFSRAFKRRFGLSPGAYRRRSRAA